MKRVDIALLLALGFVFWLAGTIYYAFQGATILETSRARYWSAFALSPIVSALLCLGILRWRQIAASDWTTAMLLLALPGMAGEVVVLSNLPTFLPRLQAATGGKYGAFLFATYGLVLAMAEVVTLRGTP